MNFKNQTIWTGDNLSIMRGLNSGSVDLIYLDPPFNSNANYAAPVGSKAAGAAFRDTWTLRDVDVAWIDLLEAKHEPLARVIRAALTPSDKSYLVYMAVRLLEMRRVLSDTGSIYLHCDPTMSHYLKVFMDAVFGRKSFRNEVVWKRTTGRSMGKRYGRVHDVILYYVGGDNATWNDVYLPLSGRQAAKYNQMDKRGAFTSDNVNAPGNNGYFYDLGKGEKTPARGYRMPEKEARLMMKRGTLLVREGKTPRRKRYLKDSKGERINDLFDDIPPVNSQAKERTGYPTQKPLALLQRIIRASSNRGDMVLDPFCGCATACIAAEAEGRKWIGIDISDKAADLVKTRMHNELGLFYEGKHRTDIPRRTDLGKLPRPAKHKKSPLRRAGRQLQRLRYALRGAAPGNRPHHR